MIFKIRAEKRGAHVHATFFTAKAHGLTMASSGMLVFREEEWPLARLGFRMMETTGRRGGPEQESAYQSIDAVEIEERGFEKERA